MLFQSAPASLRRENEEAVERQPIRTVSIRSRLFEAGEQRAALDALGYDSFNPLPPL